MVEIRVLIIFQEERVSVLKEIPVLLDQVKTMVVATEQNEALEKRRGRNLKVSVNIVANKGIRLYIAIQSHREQQGIV
jgi:hypothetical protein